VSRSLKESRAFVQYFCSSFFSQLMLGSIWRPQRRLTLVLTIAYISSIYTEFWWVILAL
jgi:hypothetical protein